MLKFFILTSIEHVEKLIITCEWENAHIYDGLFGLGHVRNHSVCDDEEHEILRTVLHWGSVPAGQHVHDITIASCALRQFSDWPFTSLLMLTSSQGVLNHASLLISLKKNGCLSRLLSKFSFSLPVNFTLLVDYLWKPSSRHVC